MKPQTYANLSRQRQPFDAAHSFATPDCGGQRIPLERVVPLGRVPRKVVRRGGLVRGGLVPGLLVATLLAVVACVGWMAH